MKLVLFHLELSPPISRREPQQDGHLTRLVWNDINVAFSPALKVRMYIM